MRCAEAWRPRAAPPAASGTRAAPPHIHAAPRRDIHTRVHARRADMPGMISIHGPRGGKYLVEFRTDDGRALGLFVPTSHAEVLRELQEAMPYGLLVRDVVGAREDFT